MSAKSFGWFCGAELEAEAEKMGAEGELSRFWEIKAFIVLLLEEKLPQNRKKFHQGAVFEAL